MIIVYIFLLAIKAVVGQQPAAVPAVVSNITNVELSIWPPEIRAPWFPENGLEWGNRTTISVNVTITDPAVQAELRVLKIRFECEDTYVCEVVEQSTNMLLFDGREQQSLTVMVEGMFIGKTALLAVELRADDPADLPLVYRLDYPVNILRDKRGQHLQDILMAVMVVFIAVNTFMMGTQLQMKAILHEVRRPYGPVIGFCCQYIVMPLVGCYLGWLWASTLLSRYSGLEFGFFAIACSPGGGNSNMWSILLEGNLDLSMTMTFFSNVAALGMMPFWLYTVGMTFFEGDNLYLPFSSIAQSLATLLIPGCMGMAFAHWQPQFIPKFRRVIKLFSFCLIIFVVGFSAYVNWYIILLFRWYTILPGIALPLSGYVISYSVAFLITRHHQNSRTIAIETGIQNGSMAILICLMSLPQPDSALTLVMPVCVLLFTGPPLWLWLVIRTVRKKRGYVDPEVAEYEARKLAKAAEAAAEKDKDVEKASGKTTGGAEMKKRTVAPSTDPIKPTTMHYTTTNGDADMSRL